MIWAQFSYMCLTGAVVASWSLTQEVASLSPLTQEVAGSSPFNELNNFFLSLNLLNSVKTFREISNTIDLHVNVSLGLKS